MNPRDLKAEITTVESVLSRFDLLEGPSHLALSKLQAIASAAEKKGAPVVRWAWPSDSPISIRPVQCERRDEERISVDFYGYLSYSADGLLCRQPNPSYQMVIRVWSSREHHVFRPEYDATVLQKTDRRVVLRYRIEEGYCEAHEPAFHMQIGGHSRTNDECCWYPEDFHRPHFPHHPLSPIMVADFVVCTFFPSFYRRLSEDSQWQRALERAQRCCLLPYLEAFVSPFLTVQGARGRLPSYCEAIWRPSTWGGLSRGVDK